MPRAESEPKRAPHESRGDRRGPTAATSSRPSRVHESRAGRARSQQRPVHDSFVVEHDYPLPVRTIWHALTDAALRDDWFSGGSEFDTHKKSHEFRLGGMSLEEGQWQGGPSARLLCTYTDIVDHERIVMTCDLWIEDRHISTSLATIVLEPTEQGCRLTLTDQSIRFLAADDVVGREDGSRRLLANLGAVAARQEAASRLR